MPVLPDTFQVLAKPSGARCNLNCRYCFYLDRAALFDRRASFRMNDEVLATYIQQLIAGQRSSDVVFACHGECPKNRFQSSSDGEPGLNYLCPAYQRFFRHVTSAMRVMAWLVQNRRSPAEIMSGSWLR